jgi:hypothetical protein
MSRPCGGRAVAHNVLWAEARREDDVGVPILLGLRTEPAMEAAGAQSASPGAPPVPFDELSTPIAAPGFAPSWEVPIAVP